MYCDKRRNCLLLGTLLLAASTGCSDVPEGTWATRLPEADAWLAVKVDHGHAAAFVCGNEQRLDLSRWMTDFADDSLEFELDGVSLTLDINDEAAVGTLLDADGVAVNVYAPRIDGQGLVGLYTAEDAGARDGLILLPAEEGESPAQELEGLGVWRDTQGNLAQVTPVKPIELTDLGISVTADPIIGTREFFMTLVVPSQVQQ